MRLLPSRMARLGSSRTNPLHFRLNESMTLCETLVADWQQALTEEKTTIGLEGKHYPVKVTRAQRVPTVEFTYRKVSFDKGWDKMEVQVLADVRKNIQQNHSPPRVSMKYALAFLLSTTAMC